MREHRRVNQNRQSRETGNIRYTRQRKTKQKHNTIYVGHHKFQGRIQDFKLGGGGGHLKKLRQAEGGAKFFGVFHVKNHDFTPKNHIFFQLWREARKFLGYFW
jgi:hypothetical protein